MRAHKQSLAPARNSGLRGEPVYRRGVQTWSLCLGQMYNLGVIYGSTSHYLCPKESTCLIPLLGIWFLQRLFVFFEGITEFDGATKCLHLSKWPAVNTYAGVPCRVFFFCFFSMCGSNGSLQLPVCCKLPKVHWQHCVFKAFEFSVYCTVPFQTSLGDSGTSLLGWR